GSLPDVRILFPRSSTCVFHFPKRRRRLRPAPHRPGSAQEQRRKPTSAKKTDVAEHPEVFHHVGLLFNETPSRSRVALYLVIREAMHPSGRVARLNHCHSPNLLNHTAESVQCNGTRCQSSPFGVK